MASRYRLSTTPQDPVARLEIRGLSRGSIGDRRLLYGTNSSLDLFSSSFQNNADVESDDESTVRGGSSSGDEFSPPQILPPSEDTVTESESSHYWSGANSSTTGNTTERSSLYSWGDDVLDHKTSRDVQEMFQAIERMLFESVLSGSSLLQQECREWMDAFPHLRIRGKQALPIRDEGFQSHSPSQATSGVATPVLDSEFLDDDTSGLSLTGSSITPQPAPEKLFTHTGDSLSGENSDLLHLHEEIFEQDGEVEEYLAYDIREMDEEDTVKRYHVPRRRRLGYPPITPNACVRDAVINQLFDNAWVKLIANLNKVKVENGGTKKTTKSLWKILFDSYTSMARNYDVTRLVENDAYLYRDVGRGAYDDDRIGLAYGSNYIEDRNPTILISQSEHFGSHLPPSSREFNEHGLRGARLSGRYLNTNRDFTSLNSVMMIKRKELINRTDKTGGLQNDPSIDMPTPSIERSGLYTRSASSKLLLPGSSSPQVYFPHSTHRQPSANRRNRSGRPGHPFRLQPLDRPKTPTAGFDWTVKAKKIPISSLGLTNLDEHSAVGIRVTSPTDPPPTAPAIPGGTLYSKNLPPLQSLHENASVDFSKRNRGRMGRISSALAEDTKYFRGWDGASRPNTTHAFRNDGIMKQRALSNTPSNFSSRALVARGMQPIKSASPTGLGPVAGGGSLFYASNFSHSPDNQIAGLAGIHGISMLGHGTSHSPHEQEDDGRTAVWGNTLRRRQQLIGN